MERKYTYLLEDAERAKKEKLIICNSFYPVSEEYITEVEKNLKINFPSQLKEFYREVGYGFLVAPKNCPEAYHFSGVNRINPPDVIQDILLEGQASGLISEETFEFLEPGDLPFFEICDSSRFLLMKLNSENPNAIWDWDLKIEDSFERFIWRLYNEGPAYYDDIITADLKKRHPDLFKNS
jgi:hypothetical protein